MKKLSNEKASAINGGIACTITDPNYLYCGNCSLGGTLSLILNGSVVNDPGSLLFRACED